MDRGGLALTARAAVAVALAGIAGTLQGCYEDGTCMWNADIMVKGCKSWGWTGHWEDCIERCNGCYDECNKMKCAAYCAKASGSGECMSNYQELCTNAVQRVDRVKGCDVDCSAAEPRARSPWGPAQLVPVLVTVLAALQTGPFPEGQPLASPQPGAVRKQRRWLAWAAASAALLLVACCLSGCCSDPAAQLPDWRPDTDAINRLANRVDDSGLWRGTGFQGEPPGFINSKQARCVNRSAPSGGFCRTWNKQASNCHESVFGKCFCLEASSSKNFCQRWACKKMEADQFICHYPMRCTSTGKHHRRLASDLAHEDDDDEDINVINGSINGQAPPSAGDVADPRARRLGHECHRTKECFPSAFQMTEQVFHLLEGSNIKFDEFSGSQRMWAVIMHDSSLLGWLQTQSLCLTPGDFRGTYEEQYHDQMQYCRGQAYFREIEEEMNHCECLAASQDKKRCDNWKCIGHKNGLFGVLFERPPPNFEDLVDGLEIAHHKCESHGDDACLEWSGRTTSWKTALMERCKCSNADCSGWFCDEYKLMVMQGWWSYVATWLFLGFGMVLTLVGLFMAFVSNVKLAAAGAAGVLILLLYLTYHGLGVWGFLFVGSPFALLACLITGLGVLGNMGTGDAGPEGKPESQSLVEE